MDTFKKDINNKFNKDRFKICREPIQCFEYELWHDNSFMVNHYCIKLKNSNMLAIVNIPRQIRDLVIDCLNYCANNSIEVYDRYIYLTVDTSSVNVGETQRDEGWHFDGMQGSEVPIKKKADFMFIVSNKLGTEISCRELNTLGLDENVHNYFKWLGNQILFPDGYCKSNNVYLLSGYQMHRGKIATKKIKDRIFVRLHFSEVPITSIKMTVNNDINYDYAIHTTSGEIPAHLI